METSISAIGKRFLPTSMIVTSEPNELKILAHSSPIAPEPMIRILSGSSVRFKISSELNMNLWSNLICGSSLGLEPVEIIIFSQS